mmetsp:Transcript_8305/g.30650  ORF Transcript_8305/g.30650 Transcript_8305/m.30650 type:complete len:160 (-) Transcript_8305:157-636(-)
MPHHLPVFFAIVVVLIGFISLSNANLLNTHLNPVRSLFLGLGERYKMQQRGGGNQPEPDDSNLSFAERIRRDIERNLRAYCTNNFSNDTEQCFLHFAGDDEQLDKDEVTNILEEIDVGNAFTRGIIASRVVSEIDTNGDSLVSLEEMKTVIEGENSASG